MNETSDSNDISTFMQKFANCFKFLKIIQIILIIFLITTLFAFTIYATYKGFSLSHFDKVILIALGLCQGFIALSIGIYIFRTKKITQQLYDELKDIVSYKYHFLYMQHQHTILNTLNFNKYMMIIGLLAIILLSIQTTLTIWGVSQWSSTANYTIMIFNFVMLLICIGIPYAFNSLLKLSHHHLLQTNGAPIQVLGKTILFTGTGTHDDPNVISPRYYQIVREIIGNGQHFNYVVQKITIIDHYSKKYEFQNYRIDYLRELKSIISGQDYKAVEVALLKNGIHIV